MPPETLFDDRGQLHPLSGCVAALAFLNNLVLYSSPWILGGTGSTWGKKFSSDHSMQASILYAISQPVYLTVFLWLGASPWLLLLALSSIHLMSTETCRVMDLQTRSQPVPALDNDKLPEKYESFSDNLVGLDYDASKGTGCRTAALALPVQTSAALDAAFLLLAADLTCNSESHMSSTASYALPFVGLVAYLSARLGDVRLAQYTHRKGLLHALTSPLGGLAAILSCLICLLMARTGLGWILERLTGYPLLQLLLLGPSKALVTFDNSRVDFVVQYAASYSENLIPILSCAQIPIYILGYYLLRRAERNNTS